MESLELISVGATGRKNNSNFLPGWQGLKQMECKLSDTSHSGHYPSGVEQRIGHAPFHPISWWPAFACEICSGRFRSASGDFKYSIARRYRFGFGLKKVMSK